MNVITKIIIAIVVIAGAFALVPALRGPFNRWRHNANDALNAEYVVDNYKEEYIKLHQKKISIEKNIQKIEVEKRIAEKKLTIATEKVSSAKNRLLATGTSDLKSFNQAKGVYESTKTEAENLSAMIDAYTQALSKLRSSLDVVTDTMTKAKANIAVLESKKALVDSLKGVNESLENINGVGDIELGANLEKLDDDMIRESIKLEANHAPLSMNAMSEDEAKSYLDGLK